MQLFWTLRQFLASPTSLQREIAALKVQFAESPFQERKLTGKEELCSLRRFPFRSPRTRCDPCPEVIDGGCFRSDSSQLALPCHGCGCVYPQAWPHNRQLSP